MRTSELSRLVFVCLCLMLWGCGKPERHYTFEGRVVSKVPATHRLVVDHGNIPGFMAAMTMPYPVASGVDLSGIEAGDRIKVRVVVKPTTITKSTRLPSRIRATAKQQQKRRSNSIRVK